MKLKKNAAGVLFITYECPRCHVPLKNLAEDIGGFYTCYACGSQFPIPGEELYSSYLDAQAQRQRPAEPVIAPEPKPAQRPPAKPAKPRPEPEFEPLQLQPDEDSAPPRIRKSPASTSRLGGSSGENAAFDDYVGVTLKKSERIIMQFGPAGAAVLALQVVLGIMILIWLAGVAVIFTMSNGGLLPALISVLYSFCMLVLPALIALMRIMKRRYTITNQRIVSRSGLASLSVNEVRNDAVSGLSIRQSLFGRWFGYGTVHVYADGTSLRLSSVDQPIGIASAVQTAVHASKADGN